MLKILITGSKGFIAQNLIAHLSEISDIKIIEFSRENDPSDLKVFVKQIDFVFHLAGVNRPLDLDEFKHSNVNLTEILCKYLVLSKRKIPIIFASSIQANSKNNYGDSKLLAEKLIKKYSKLTESKVYIYRFPNIFGKWCKPNYNSVVATFCNNIANNLPIEIHDSNHKLELMYIDDIIAEFLSVIFKQRFKSGIENIPTYKISVGNLANRLKTFHKNRKNLIVESVGLGFSRALYSTYLSYLKPEFFSYPIQSFKDDRGIFAEILKTENSGQVSFFSSNPGQTRGEHYHHTKNEKFLVVSGDAKFNFRHIITNQEYSINTSGSKLEIVETIPGWAHDIKNVGTSEMKVILWANEIFEIDRPDTYKYIVSNEKN